MTNPSGLPCVSEIRSTGPARAGYAEKRAEQEAAYHALLELKKQEIK